MAFSGIILPFLMQPTSNIGDRVLVSTVLSVIGVVMLIASLLSLNMSMGIIAARRKIHTGGMYRMVRHPMYLSYFFLFTGYFWMNYSYWNGILLLLIVWIQITRIYQEEGVWSSDGDYQDYAKKVRWRIMPGIF
jgi:protein-S-isoprenylcysteine O-methyltransferase Ste14